MARIEQPREAARDARHLRCLDTVLHDLRYAGRVLRHSPGFTLVAVLTLAVGIGGITTIFSVVNGIILRPLPYGAADRLVKIDEVRAATVNGRPYAAPPKDADWPNRAQIFEGLTWLEYAPFTLADGSD